MTMRASPTEEVMKRAAAGLQPALPFNFVAVDDLQDRSLTLTIAVASHAARRTASLAGFDQ